MDYIKYYDEIVSKRHSVREYSDREVEEEIISELKEYYEGIGRLTDADTELLIIDASFGGKVGKSAGYNGFFVEAPGYLILLSDKSEHYLENAGYIGQGLTLKLTELGVQTCWLTINDSYALKAAAGVESDKEASVIIAFGYEAEQKKEKRLDIKSPSNVRMIESESKAAPKIRIDDFAFGKVYGKPLDVSILYTGLSDAIIAAGRSQSFFNRQPYRLIVDDAVVSLIGLEDEMTTEEDTLLNYGICMFDFYAVLSANRNGAETWTFEDSDIELKLPAGARYIAKCRI